MKKKSKRIALFGGSFNPPHISHQMICLYLLVYKEFDHVRMIPTYEHPFHKKLISFEHRSKMCNLLARPFFGGVYVDNIEAYLSESTGKQCYTIDVVRDFTTRWPDDKFTLIIGSDIVSELDDWKDFPEIETLVDVMVIFRKKDGKVINMRNGRLVGPRPFDVFDKPEYSSTEIRELIAQGKPIDHCVPPRIVKYIKKNKLYV